MQVRSLLALFVTLFALAAAELVRDGASSGIGGWPGLAFQAVRFEPVCGSLVNTFAPGDSFTNCVPAMDSYTNDTHTTLAFYDVTGIRLPCAGVGLGKDVCMCFSLSTISNAAKLDICWYFSANGQVARNYWGEVYGNWRTSGKALPHCANVNLASLQQEWTQTAFMPSYTGTTQNRNIAPTTTAEVESL